MMRKLLKLCWRRSKDGEAAVAEKLPELLPITTALLVDTSHEARLSQAVGFLKSVKVNRFAYVCMYLEFQTPFFFRLFLFFFVGSKILESKVRATATEAVDVLMSLSGNSDLAPHMDEIMGCAKGNRDA